uniref:Secreted protein n=1 Tax=Heterorhabditis bacteriophora TaxID=37862 RepID=A0A1I7WEU4_HETBA
MLSVVSNKNLCHFAVAKYALRFSCATIIIYFLIVLRHVMKNKSIISKSTKRNKNCYVCVQCWSVEKDYFSSMTIPDHMSHK